MKKKTFQPVFLLCMIILCTFYFPLQESIEKFGCKTPFGLNSDNICTDQDLSNKAAEFYKSQWKNRFNIKQCPYPCKSLKVYMGRGSEYKEPKLKFKFNKFIKTTKSRYAYQELELLAEFGGYVGLFLGISVFHLREVFQTLIHIVLPD